MGFSEVTQHGSFCLQKNISMTILNGAKTTLKPLKLNNVSSQIRIRLEKSAAANKMFLWWKTMNDENDEVSVTTLWKTTRSPRTGRDATTGPVLGKQEVCLAQCHTHLLLAKASRSNEGKRFGGYGHVAAAPLPERSDSEKLQSKRPAGFKITFTAATDAAEWKTECGLHRWLSVFGTIALPRHRGPKMRNTKVQV